MRTPNVLPARPRGALQRAQGVRAVGDQPECVARATRSGRRVRSELCEPGGCPRAISRGGARVLSGVELTRALPSRRLGGVRPRET